MRFRTAFVVPALAVGLAMSASAQEIDPQTRQQIAAVHAKFVAAMNTGDVDAMSSLYKPNTVQIDVFGRKIGVDREFVQALHKKGITVSMPVDGVLALSGGQTAIAYGTFTSKYLDPNVPPGQGNWVQVFERDGEGWKIVAHASSRSALAAQMK